MAIRTDVPYIDGSPAELAAVARFEVVNPATEQVVAEPVLGDDRHVDAAVTAAQRAQRQWAALPAHRRGEVLWRWAELIGAHAEELARLDTINMGRAIRDSLPEARAIGRVPRYWAGMADKICGTELPVVPGHHSYVRREPLGTVAVILPWNGPVGGFVERVSAATACGNAVVVKPSELAPQSSILLAHLATEAGMPPGLVNVITGDGSTGAKVVAHPGVAGVSFTGSVATGRAVARAAADGLKKVTLELGGKSPNIVFPDADLDEVLRGTLWGVFYNSGQVCCAGTRLLVHRAIADELVERLARRAERIRVGDPLDPSTHIGPVASRVQYQRVTGYIQEALAKGARPVTGGGRPQSLPDRGFFIAPTVLDRVDPHDRVCQDEIFGPVLTVIPFDDEDHAVHLANDVRYGLAAKVWTSDINRMLRMATELEAGSVWGNTAQVYDPAFPFGGFKDSGVGNDSAQGAVEANTRLKTVSIRFDPSAPRPGWDDLDE